MVWKRTDGRHFERGRVGGRWNCGLPRREQEWQCLSAHCFSRFQNGPEMQKKCHFVFWGQYLGRLPLASKYIIWWMTADLHCLSIFRKPFGGDWSTEPNTSDFFLLKIWYKGPGIYEQIPPGTYPEAQAVLLCLVCGMCVCVVSTSTEGRGGLQKSEQPLLSFTIRLPRWGMLELMDVVFRRKDVKRKHPFWKEKSSK